MKTFQGEGEGEGWGEQRADVIPTLREPRSHGLLVAPAVGRAGQQKRYRSTRCVPV
jgi:hypothetical protein